MNVLDVDYRKYKWFFTSSEKLVIGGKSAEQNEELLQTFKKSNEGYIMMHTAEAGSPFSVILTDIKNVTKEDKKECAIFTACFSRAWRERKKRAEVHIFTLSQLYKEKGMKSGTWGVSNKIEKLNAPLALALIKQKGVLRAVPEKSVKNKKDIIAKIFPGSVDKNHVALKILKELNIKLAQDELLSALPAGGFSIKKP